VTTREAIGCVAKPKKDDAEPVLEALQNILIVQLAQAGLDNHAIAKIAGIHVTRVIPIATLIKKKIKKG
jgi:hypothetical protein